MTRAVVYLLLPFLLWLGGCAYDKALDRADAWARAGQWEQALREYRRANRLDPDASEAIEGISMSLQMIAEAQVAGARRSLDARDYEGAFRKAKSAKDADPELLAADQLMEAIASKAMGESKDLASAGDFGAAMDVLAMVGRHRPELDAELEAMGAELSRDWSVVLRAEADKDLAAKDTGAAFVRMAMVASLTGSQADAQQRDELRAAVMKGQSYAIALKIEGDPARASRIRSRVAGLFVTGGRQIRVGQKATDPGVSLRARIGAGECGQTSRVEVANHRYISGTRQVQNPEWLSQREGLIRIERDLLAAERRADDALEDLERAEDDYERAERDQRQDLDRYRRTMEDRRDGLREARRRMRRLREEILRCHEQIDRVAPFLDEDVFSDFSYEVRTWTRVCKVGWEGELVGADGSDTMPFEQVEAASTSDQAHAAHVRFGIGEDPLRFPASDAGLIAAADKKAAMALGEIGLGRFRAYRDDLASQAQAISAEDPAAAARLSVVAYLLEPDNALAGPGLWLREQFGMRDPYVLVKRGM